MYMLFGNAYSSQCVALLYSYFNMVHTYAYESKLKFEQGDRLQYMYIVHAVFVCEWLILTHIQKNQAN